MQEFTINSDTHLLEGASYICSPNHSPRPKDVEIDLLVIHCISLPPNQFKENYIEQFFINSLDHNAHPYFKSIEHLKVSAHILIKRDGQVFQFVPFDQCAWHAGQSEFKGRKHCNDFSIGIELEGAVDIPFCDVQYELLINISNIIMQHYPLISKDRIVGHSDVAPGRKKDPGEAFNWDYFKSGLQLLKN